MTFPTRQQVGILLVCAGTIFLAFAIKADKQYESGPHAEVAKRVAKDGFMQISDTTINLFRLRLGVALVGVGSLLQL
jgi:hypothetical protein